jgi:hypothetical protein
MFPSPTISRDLIRKAIELREKGALADFADTRMKTCDREAALSHDDLWKGFMSLTLYHHTVVCVKGPWVKAVKPSPIPSIYGKKLITGRKS